MCSPKVLSTWKQFLYYICKMTISFCKCIISTKISWTCTYVFLYFSLCFVTYYYAECPFGKFPVDCDDDLCAGRRCPGYPNAVCRVNRCGSCSYEWYNGVTGNILQCQGECILDYGKLSKIRNTNCLPKRPRQKRQTQIRPLRKKRSDQGIPYLLLWQEICEFQPWETTFYLRTEREKCSKF